MMRNPDSLIDAERLAITEVAKRLNVHVATVWRWVKGVGGRRLPSVKILGRRYVLLADLEDFLTANAEPTASPTAPPRSTSRQRQRRVDAAEAELDRLGITGDENQEPTDSG